MSSKVLSIGLSKHEKMIEYHVHIRSTDHFKQVGMREKNDRNEINSGGSPRLTMHLRNHLLITNGFPFWYCLSGSRSNLPGWLCTVAYL